MRDYSKQFSILYTWREETLNLLNLPSRQENEIDNDSIVKECQFIKEIISKRVVQGHFRDQIISFTVKRDFKKIFFVIRDAHISRDTWRASE